MNLPLKLKPKPAAAKPAAAKPAVSSSSSAKPADPKKTLVRPGAVGRATPASSQQRSVVRPRQRVPTSQYRASQHSASFGGIPEGDLFYLKDAPSFQIIRPDWKGTFPTTFRPFPTINVDDLSSFEPGRYSARDRDFTDWVRALPAAKFVGLDSPVSFLLYDPRWKNDQGYNPRENPYNILYYAIKDVVESDEPSAILGKRDVFNVKWIQYHKKKFSPPNNKATFIQGAVYQHRDKVYVSGGKPPLGLSEKDNPVMIEMLSGSVWDSLCEVLMQKPEGVRASSDDIQGSFLYGDPTLLNGGAFLSAYNPDKHKAAIDFQFGLTKQLAQGADEEVDTIEYEDPNADDDDDSRSGKKKKKEFTSWKIAAGHNLFYTNQQGLRKKANPDLTQYEDRIRQQFMWFDDLFHFPETEEVVVILARAFRGVPNMLRFGWADNPEFFTDEVKGILAARTQGSVPEVPTDDDELDESNIREAGGGRRSAALIDELDADDSLSDDELLEDDDAFEADAELDDEAETSAEADDTVDEYDPSGEDADVQQAEQAAAQRAARRLPLKINPAAPGGTTMAASKKPATKAPAKPAKKAPKTGKSGKK